MILIRILIFRIITIVALRFVFIADSFLWGFFFVPKNVDEEELKELMDAAMSMSGDLEFKDDGYIELVLRILGLMCDNQHHDIQVRMID